MIEIDLVTGFLGSGKTTFIRKYARYLMKRGENIAILENDHGAVNVDALLLHDLEEEGCDVETIAGGCDHDCHIRRCRTKLIAMGMLGYDRVIVEPSGIYDVDEFFDVLHDEPLDQWYEIGNVVTIVDARMLRTEAAGTETPGEKAQLSRETRYFLMSQAANAGLLLLSHVEPGEGEGNSYGDEICFLNGIMEEFKCDRRFSGENLLAKDWNALTGDDFAAIASCGYTPADHIKLPLEDDNGFTSLYFLNLPFPLSQLREKAVRLLRDKTAGHVLRIKGFHREDGQWYELNASETSVTVGKCQAGQELFIVIGEDLDREIVQQQLEVGGDVWHNGNVYAGLD